MSNEAPPPGMPVIKSESQPEDAHGKQDPLYRELGLWSAALGGAVAWFLDLNVRYFLVEAYWARTREGRILLSGAFALLIAACCAWLSFRYFQRFREREGKQPAAFVAGAGAVLNALFMLLIAASLLPHALLGGAD